ncbi:hypothetical protein C9994_05015 [Marivirga lumbricoides]|uniref:HEPN AbiJ-N-terminal domain-containing protein n=1 Tax=Marivirga lumbricoides TaxID=1046115 RepID=A0A2T4DT53_9BACT|nr:hypothetical protein C9994_05015 [Marivirga lumbricoides]
MKLRFSDRIGKTKVRTDILKEGLTPEMENSLWTLIHDLVLEPKSNEPGYNKKYSDLTKFYRNLWIHFFKRPIDKMPRHYSQVDSYEAKTILRDHFYKAEWYEKLNLVEFCFEDEGKQLHEVCNDFLKREFSAYRFVDGIIVEVNSKEEIIEIEEALNQSDKFKPVKTHLSTALRLLADKKSPDYRNSIKESISAVESISKIIVADNSTTLGQALKEIEKRHKIPKSLKSAFSTLYGYTSDVGGIRHALLDGDDEVKLEEAKFMLVACSAFINYLITKI